MNDTQETHVENISHHQSILKCQGGEIENFRKIECELLFDIGCRTDSENICVGIRVILRVCFGAQQAYYGGYHEKLERFVRYFLILVGEISSSWVQFIQMNI